MTKNKRIKIGLTIIFTIVASLWIIWTINLTPSSTQEIKDDKNIAPKDNKITENTSNKVTGQTGKQVEKHGGNIIFEDTKTLAPVIFSHEYHLGKNLECANCHPQPFKKEKGSTNREALSMESLRKNEFCGVCHNDAKTDAKAFGVNSNCLRCHKKVK